MTEKPRPRSGSGSLPAWEHRQKLSPTQRQEIRERRSDGERAKDLAAEYGVSTQTVYNS